MALVAGPQDTTLDRNSLDALRRVFDIPLLVALAFALFAVGIWLAVVEAGVMRVSLARILAVQHHLETGGGPRGGVAVLGSSVVVEGVDCAVLRAQLRPAAPCENLAWTGGDLRQWLLIQPALRRSPPAVLVLGLDLFTLLDPTPIPADRLALAGWWEFVPGSDLPELAHSLSAVERAILLAPRATQLLRFRSFPLGALNEHFREVARADLRYDGYVENFEAPWLRRAPASPEAMQKHLEQTARRIHTGGLERLPETQQILEILIKRVRTSHPETRVVLVLTPIHPHLARMLGPDTLDALRRSLDMEARRLEAHFLDHSASLGADGFSDAVHPFADGRGAWSIQLGEGIASLTL